MLNKVENIVAKAEIAHHEQFHLWPQRFQKSSAAIASECVCRRENVKVCNLSIIAMMKTSVGRFTLTVVQVDFGVNNLN